jgi:hypothetical protein
MTYTQAYVHGSEQFYSFETRKVGFGLDLFPGHTQERRYKSGVNFEAELWEYWQSYKQTYAVVKYRLPAVNCKLAVG